MSEPESSKLRRKEIALYHLARRKAQMTKLHLPPNEEMHAGHPMWFRCVECGAPIFVDEEYVERQKHCGECLFLIAQGWLT